MKTEAMTYSNEQWQIYENILDKNRTNLVFIFGDREEIKKSDSYFSLKKIYPNAHIVGCSSSGNILGDTISSNSLVATAVEFEKSSIKISVKDFTNNDDLYEVSQALIDDLEKKDLKHIFILSDGLNMNGSILAKGINSVIDSEISITGGLAGDGLAFEETWVIADDVAKQNRLVAIGFYGEALHISSGCYDGWDEFGIYRRITKAEGNIVYEIDNQPALDLYKKYLGEYANDLPGAGLYFPFNVKDSLDAKQSIIRAVLAIDEEEKSLIFAGDVSQNSYARLMKTNIDGLIDGSETAAKDILQHNDKSALGLVVSCVGRRVVLDQLSDEELEVIDEVLGSNVALTGFYSYGELAPHSTEILNCQLHNQTMTLTAIYED